MENLCGETGNVGGKPGRGRNLVTSKSDNKAFALPFEKKPLLSLREAKKISLKKV